MKGAMRGESLSSFLITLPHLPVSLQTPNFCPPIIRLSQGENDFSICRWCEECYEHPVQENEPEHLSTMSSGFGNIQVHNGLCVSRCLMDDLLNGVGEGGSKQSLFVL